MGVLTKGKKGLLEQVNGGTLFLDEIGDLPLDLQVKLLKVVEENRFMRIGSTQVLEVDVRIISATHKDLKKQVSEGKFREDLYYRLNVFPIYVPPLRERMEDVPALVEAFITRHAAEEGRRVSAISSQALDLLMVHDWPGNIRQLENAVFRAVVLAETPTLQPGDFPQILAAQRGNDEARATATSSFIPSEPIHIDQAAALPRLPDAGPVAIPDRFLDGSGGLLPLAEIEKDLIAFAIEHNAGRMAQVARQLGIGRSTLYRKLKEYGFDSDVA
jgi:DNA-binding NtrC family response regulator